MIKNKKKGFAMVLTVTSLAIILGIFFVYSATSRMKKVDLIKSSTYSNLEDSVSQSMSVGIYEGYIIDQMITKNPKMGVKNYLDYFIVANTNLTTDYTSAVSNDIPKIWEKPVSYAKSPWKNIALQNEDGKDIPDKGIYKGTWTYTVEDFQDKVNLSRGGFFIVSIVDATNPTVPLYSLERKQSLSNGKILKFNDQSKYSYSENYIEKALIQDYWGTAAVNRRGESPTFDIVLYKNILLKTDAGSNNIRNYDVFVRARLNYPSFNSQPQFTEAAPPTTAGNISRKLLLDSSKVISYEINHIGP